VSITDSTLDVLTGQMRRPDLSLTIVCRSLNRAAMIQRRRKRALKPTLMIAILALITGAANAQTQQASKPKPIQGSGCVQKAVESSCQVLTDSKTGEVYNLFFSAKVPKNGTAIWFKGAEHQGMTTCMQGKPVNVTKWKREKGIKCPPAAAPATTH
jgi:hypothetical protein